MHDKRHELPTGAPWLSAPSPSSPDGLARAVREALDLAVLLARAGDCERARELCASAFFEAQPTIAANEELLRATLHALLVANGFKLLSRVIMAVTGRSVQVVLLTEETEHVAPPRTWQEPRRTVYALDPRWLARLSRDDVFLRHWCDMLTAQRASGPDLAAAASTPLHLEPV